MLQCVNRRNYKQCVDTLLTSFCANGRERAEREKVFFLFNGIEYVKVVSWMDMGRPVVMKFIIKIK